MYHFVLTERMATLQKYSSSPPITGQQHISPDSTSGINQSKIGEQISDYLCCTQYDEIYIIFDLYTHFTTYSRTINYHPFNLQPQDRLIYQYLHFFPYTISLSNYISNLAKDSNSLFFFVICPIVFILILLICLYDFLHWKVVQYR